MSWAHCFEVRQNMSDKGGRGLYSVRRFPLLEQFNFIVCELVLGRESIVEDQNLKLMYWLLLCCLKFLVNVLCNVYFIFYFLKNAVVLKP